MKKIKQPKTITAEEFDALFDAGESFLPYVNLEGVRPLYPPQTLILSLPSPLRLRLDEAASALGVSPESLVAVWTAERLGVPVAPAT